MQVLKEEIGGLPSFNKESSRVLGIQNKVEGKLKHTLKSSL